MKRILLVILICTIAATLVFSASAEIYSGECDRGVNWTFDTENGILNVSGNGFIKSFRSPYQSDLPWLNFRDSIKSVVVEEGVTHIGACAFALCNNLVSVTLPSTIQTIGEYAFNTCPNLASIHIGDNVTELGGWAFAGCDALKEVRLGAKITAIAERAFYHCDSLESITLPFGVTEIGADAFGYCKNLKEIILPNSVTYIYQNAFANCPELGSAIIPDSVKYIGTAAFENCEKLVIYGFDSSRAAEHAASNGLRFVSVDDATASASVVMTINKSFGFINGNVKMLDAAPIIRNDRTMLPFRFVSEAFGATVTWDGATSTATVTTDDVEIRITMGDTVAYVNGIAAALDSPAFIQNDRAYLPVRFVAEALGATVGWDGVTSTATLTK